MIQKLKKIFGLTAEKGTISKKKIAKYLPENPIIFEAGASNGIDSLELCKQFPKGHIHAFEPIPAVFAELKKRVEGQQNISLYPIALDGKNGVTTMYLSGDSDDTRSSSSLLKPKEHINFHEHIPFEEELSVPVKTIDTWAAENGVTQIDFMWLDMQGNELTALKAAPNILKTVKVIYTEVSLIETYEEVPLYEDYKKWLVSQGFKVTIEALAWEDMGNVLFVREN
ncbi:MAG: FkbM family methyltransferase [Saprospiraceae bacterium]